MKRALVDTHALLWFVFDDPRLSAAAAEVLEDRDTRKLVSIASLWEITIKVQIGKLGLDRSLEDFFRDFVEGRELDVLPIETQHLIALGSLPLLHRDPFDRLLIAQATSENLPVVTSDRAFESYGLATIG